MKRKEIEIKGKIRNQRLGKLEAEETGSRKKRRNHRRMRRSQGLQSRIRGQETAMKGKEIEIKGKEMEIKAKVQRTKQRNCRRKRREGTLTRGNTDERHNRRYNRCDRM